MVVGNNGASMVAKESQCRKAWTEIELREEGRVMDIKLEQKENAHHSMMVMDAGRCKV